MDHSPCSHCIAKPVCFARNREQLDYRNHSHRIFERKDFLLRTGERFKGVYALRSGAAKSMMTIEGGHEQIIHFHFPGELLGGDGFDNDVHINDIQFLDTSSVCFFSKSELARLLAESEDIRGRLLAAMSREITNDHESLLSISQLSSAQRLARFVLALSQRFAERGLSPNSFDLPMTRGDIANHLGMAMETVSRLFKRFERDGAVYMEQRHLTILDRNKLSTYISPKPLIE